MARRTDFEAQLAFITQLYNRKTAAAQMGVSERTLRRWMNEGVRPRRQDIKDRVYTAFRKNKRKIQRINRRYKGADKIQPPEIDIPLLGERRVLQARDELGEPIEDEFYLSEWVNYDVTGLAHEWVLEALKRLRDRKAIVQIIYYAPETDPEYPGMRGATTPIDLDGFSDKRLENLFMSLVRRGVEFLYVADIEERRR